MADQNGQGGHDQHHARDGHSGSHSGANGGLVNRIGHLIEVAPTKRAFSLWEQFKAFAFKGNVIDLAVGVIVGTAFGKIVDSLVKSIIMPLLGILLPGNKGYLGWKWVIDGKEVPYGQFLGEVMNFLIVSAALFLFIVKFLGWLVRSKPNPPPLTADQQLLTEIRDLLKERVQSPAPAGQRPG